MTTATIILVLLVAAGLVGVYLAKRADEKKKSTTSPQVPAPVVTITPPGPLPEPTPPSEPGAVPVPPAPGSRGPVDPFGVGFATLAAFEIWANNFQNALYLDGKPYKGGFGPSVYFKTTPEGGVVVVD